VFNSPFHLTEVTTRMSTKIRALAAAALAALAIALPAPTWAQGSSQVRFQPGKSSAVLNGTVSGHKYHDYLLRARAGQRMTVKLTVGATNGHGSAYFNILPPGSDNVAIYNSSTSGNRNGSVRLPEDGEYRIRVYLMGNDKDANKTVGYRLKATIG
jgi:hypothetical protein